MGTMTVRGLDEGLMQRLRIRAAENGRSMEEELHEILKVALAEPAERPFGLGTRIHNAFLEVGGVDLPRVERGSLRPAPDFGDGGE